MDSNKFVAPSTITELQRKRIEQGYTYQGLEEACAENGERVPMSTIRRVFAEDAEKHRFSFETVRPLIHLLMGVDTPTQGNEPPETVDVLKENITMLHRQLEDQRRIFGESLEAQRTEYARQILAIAEENQKKIDYITTQVDILSRQIEIKDRRIDMLMEQVLHKG